jgi:hypothetical protein
MSLDEPRSLSAPPPPPVPPSRARPLLVRLVVVAGSFALCAGSALLGTAAMRDPEALRPLGWLAATVLVAGLAGRWLRDRRRAERRRRFEEWWTQVSERQWPSPPEGLDT